MRSIGIVIAVCILIVLGILAIREGSKSFAELKAAERIGQDYAQLIKKEESEGTHRLYEHVVMPIQKINLKSEPKERSGSLIKLDVNDEVIIISWDLINSYWLKAEFNNKTGYLDSRLVKIRPQSVNVKAAKNLFVRYLWEPDVGFWKNIKRMAIDFIICLFLSLVFAGMHTDNLEMIIMGIPMGLFLVRQGMMDNFGADAFKIGYFILALSIYSVFYGAIVNAIINRIRGL